MRIQILFSPTACDKGEREKGWKKVSIKLDTDQRPHNP